MIDPVKNFAKATVSTTYDASATSIVLTSGHGAKFPAPSTDGAFNLVWWNSTDYPDPADDPNVEIVRVTARSTDTLTVTRAQEGTSASTKNTGGKVYKMMLAITKLQWEGTPIIIRQYTSSGSPHTWTKPAGLKYLVVECQGAGGDAVNGAPSGGSAGGGGGGGYTRKVILASACGSTETVTVGAAGVGSGNTSFGSLLTAGNGGNASGSTGGSGGAASGGDFNVAGQTGSNGNSGSPASGNGTGGGSYMGNGGSGGFSSSTGGSTDGQPGGGYGAGGGASGPATDGSPAGSRGASTGGCVVVTEYY